VWDETEGLGNTTGANGHMPRLILASLRVGSERERRRAIARVLLLRLEEARTLADMMRTETARKQMAAIARGYERLAMLYNEGDYE